MKATLLSRAALLGRGLSLLLGCSEPWSRPSALLDPPPLPTARSWWSELVFEAFLKVALFQRRGLFEELVDGRRAD